MQTAIREFAITLYLTAFRIIFSICKLFPQKKKTVFVSSFGDNILYVLNELKKTDTEIILLQTNGNQKLEIDPEITSLSFQSHSPREWVKSIYHLATCEFVFVDNYYGFLAATPFKKNVPCIQLWHAAGAVKKFGLHDPSNKFRSKRANKRFQAVYDCFDKIVVGSDKMAEIMKTSFGASDERILKTGIPRTDFFYDAMKLAQAKDKLLKAFPQIKDKKVILYAPTFRDHALHMDHFPLDVDKMALALGNDYVLLVRAHPAVKLNFNNQHPEFLIDVSNAGHVNDLLTITDILITDYSSIPFEFSVMNKPMIFYPYDLFDYMEERGFYEPYEVLVPGPITFSTEEIIETILKDDYPVERIREFAKEWNEYSTGNANEQLITALYGTRVPRQVEVNQE